MSWKELRTTSVKCPKIKNACAKPARLVFFIVKINMQICDTLVVIVVA